MRLSAIIPSTLLILAALLFAQAVEAQQISGTHSRQFICLCGFEEATGAPFCFEDAFCSDLTVCITSADCPAGTQCLNRDNGCGQPVCAPLCDPPTCSNPGTLTTGFEACLDGAPTLGQWGLITLAALLLLTGAAMIRLKGRTARAAFILVFLSVLTAAWAYASIQANPKTCEAVESSVLADVGR